MTPLFCSPTLGHVPVIIPVAWFMMIYPSYILANLIADGMPVGTRVGRCACYGWRGCQP